MLISRTPPAALLPYVKSLWLSHELPPGAGSTRELVLPTGTMQLVFRLGAPLRTFHSGDDVTGQSIGTSVIGGMRAAPSLRDVSLPQVLLGAQLRPGAGGLLLGASAAALAYRHTSLSDLWGREAELTREHLAEAGGPERQLDALERVLLMRCASVARPLPIVAHALARLDAGATIATVVAESGYSHKHLLALFREAVGLPPKLYARVLRFQRALALQRRRPSLPWAELALSAGFSDQAHFARDFRELSGLSPGEYLRARPQHQHHVPLASEACAARAGKISSRPHGALTAE